MSTPRPGAEPRLFYGWWVVAAAFAVTFLGFGSAYTFSNFLEPLQRDFGASRGSVSLVFALAGFLYFGLGIVSGPLADRFGARPLVLTGMILLGLGLALAGAAKNLIEVDAAYGLGVGLGMGFAYVPAIGAVQRWFVRRRGTASGIAIAGIGVGTLIGAPLAHELIEGLGWRRTYLVLAALTALGAIAAGLLVRSGPEHYGQAPDGDPLPSPGSVPAGLSIGEALRTGPFWAIYASAMLMSFGLFAPFVHLAPYSRDIGLGEGFGIMLIVLLGVGSTVGRFLFASLTNWLGRRLSFAMMYVGAGLMLVMWSLSTSGPALIVFALVFGAFYGGFVAIAPSLAADYFGAKALGSVIGALYSGVAFGALLGSPVAGFAYDVFGAYAGAILAGAALCFVSFAIMLFTPEPAHWLARRKSPR
jgi:MFS family permease